MTENNYSKLVVFGGFQPATSRSKLIEAAFRPEDINTIPKAPILFDQNDIKYLMQFPNNLHSKALSYRYGKLPFEMDKMVKKGQDIPDVIETNIDNKLFRVSTYGKELYEKLTKPRDLEKISVSTPDELRDKDNGYKGGHYGFDLSGEMSYSSGKSNTRLSKNFIGMGSLLASNTIGNWRTGVLQGFLNRYEKFQDDILWKPVTIKGSKPEKEYFVDWRGEVKERDGHKVMPVWAPHVLEKWFGADNITDDGRVQFTDDPSDTSHVIAYSSGKMIPSLIVKSYEKLHKELNEMIGKGKSVDNIVEKIHKLKDGFVEDSSGQEIQIDAQRDIYDWEASKYNPAFKLTPKYSQTFGGISPLNNEKEQIAGKSKDWNMIKKNIVGTGGSVVSPSGNLVRGAIASGIRDGLSNLPSYEQFALSSMEDELNTQAEEIIMGLSGDPVYTKYAQVLRGEADVPDAWKSVKKKNSDPTKNLHKIAFDKVKFRAYSFVKEVAQLDWGRGTRRIRDPRRAYRMGRLNHRIEDMNRNISGTGGDASQFISDKSKGLHASMRSNMGEIEKRSRGERSDIRKGQNTLGGEIIIGSSISNIENKIAEIKKISQERKALEDQMAQAADDVKTGKIKPSQTINLKNDTMQTLIKDANARSIIYQEALDSYMVYQISNGNTDFNMTDAVLFAKSHLYQELKKAGIDVSEIDDVQFSKTELNALEKDKKDMVNMVAQQRNAIEKTIPKTTQLHGNSANVSMNKLFQDPQAMAKIQTAIDNAVPGSDTEAYWTDAKNKLQRYLTLNSPKNLALAKQDPNVLNALVAKMNSTYNKEEQQELLAFINRVKRDLGQAPVALSTSAEIDKIMAAKHA